MGGGGDPVHGHRGRLLGDLEHLEAPLVEVADQVDQRVDVVGVDGPPGPERPDPLPEGAVARPDHRAAGDDRLGHDVPERLGVGPGQQHDVDAGPVEQVRQQRVVVATVQAEVR